MTDQTTALPIALTMSAEELVRGKREELLDRMEELTRWAMTAYEEAEARRDRISSSWDQIPDDRSAYVLAYRQLSSQLTKATRAAQTLNAELARRM